jgi:signal transduction histidine kinase
MAAEVSERLDIVQRLGPTGTVFVAGPALVRDRLACVVVSDSRAAESPRPYELAIFTQMLALLATVAQREEVSAQLATARDEALAASRAKSEFLATMSHEIRTPLNGVIGLSELLSRTELSTHQRRFADGIDQAGRALLALVNDILDLSKVEAGKLDLVFAEVGLNEVVAGAVALLQPEANRGRIIIRSSLAPKLPAVMADPRSLKQVVLNLLSNAVKFSPAGGQVIVSTARSDRGEAVIRIRDTGAGMSEGEIEAALEPFGHVSPTARGTGLGLPLTKALVEANRASLAIHSTVGTGTLVEVIFPPTRVVAGEPGA